MCEQSWLIPDYFCDWISQSIDTTGLNIMKCAESWLNKMKWSDLIMSNSSLLVSYPRAHPPPQVQSEKKNLPGIKWAKRTDISAKHNLARGNTSSGAGASDSCCVLFSPGECSPPQGRWQRSGCRGGGGGWCEKQKPRGQTVTTNTIIITSSSPGPLLCNHGDYQGGGGWPRGWWSGLQTAL